MAGTATHRDYEAALPAWLRARDVLRGRSISREWTRRHAAATLASSVYRLRRLATRYDWRSRTAAFDNYRADASSRALDQLLQQEAFDWKDRTEQFRLTEWALHEQMLQAASAAADEVRKHPNRVSLTGLLKLYELASALGRRACGMPLDNVEPKPEPPSLRPEFEAALNKVYGPPPDAAASAPPDDSGSNRPGPSTLNNQPFDEFHLSTTPNPILHFPQSDSMSFSQTDSIT